MGKSSDVGRGTKRRGKSPQMTNDDSMQMLGSKLL